MQEVMKSKEIFEKKNNIYIKISDCGLRQRRVFAKVVGLTHILQETQ